MFYDLEKHERCWLLPVGTFGQISFERLAEMFAANGEVKPSERITHFDVRDDFIRFRVERSASQADREYQFRKEQF